MLMTQRDNLWHILEKKPLLNRFTYRDNALQAVPVWISFQLCQIHSLK